MTISDDELSGFAEKLQNNIKDIKQNTDFLKEVLTKKLIKFLLVSVLITLILSFGFGWLVSNHFRFTAKQSILTHKGCESYGGRWGAFENRVNYCVFEKK